MPAQSLLKVLYHTARSLQNVQFSLDTETGSRVMTYQADKYLRRLTAPHPKLQNAQLGIKYAIDEVVDGEPPTVPAEPLPVPVIPVTDTGKDTVPDLQVIYKTDELLAYPPEYINTLSISLDNETIELLTKENPSDI